MSTVLADIRSTNWQISTAGFGVIAEGLEDIRQCLDILLRTPRGSDAFRAEFGSNIFEWVDAPVNTAAPNIKRAIIEAVEIWEQRVKIVTISHYLQESTMFFKVTYQLANQDIIDSLLIAADGSAVSVSQPGSLILQAFYPPNPNGRLYYFRLVLDDVQAQPLPPTGGFSTLNGLFSWAANNLAYAGRWVQLVDRIVLYLKPGFATSASMAIELLLSTIQIKAYLPVLDAGETYSVQLDHPGLYATETILVHTGTNTKDALQLYMQQNYNSYGDWSVMAATVDILGDFNATEFSNDFNIGGSGYYLVLTSTTLTEGLLAVNNE